MSPLLTADQMASIRSLGEQGMTVDVIISRHVPSVTGDDENPFGAADPTFSTTTTTVKGWLVSQMDRNFDEDGGRVVAVHDLTVRVPVGTQIDARDKVTIMGADYTVMESNSDDTWPEWTEAYLKKLA
jgi:hypothetical protein